MKTTKRLTPIFLALFFLPILISAQEWKTVHPIEDYTRYVDGYFSSDDQIILVGNFGNMIRSEDAGETWTKIELGTEENLTIVEEIPGTGGMELLCASWTELFKSTDSGQTWNQVATDYILDDPRDIEFVDDNTVLLADRSGLVFKSEDSGNTWDSIRVTTERHFWEMDVFESGKGWAVTYSGDVYQTLDAGSSWDSIAFNESTFSRAIHFVDEMTGYVVGRSGKFLKTIDGGLTWDEIDESGFPSQPSTFQIVNENEFYVTTLTGYQYAKSIDGGLNWQMIDGVNYETNRNYKFKILDDGRFWLIGDRQVVAKSDDSGTTWTELFPAHKYDFPFVEFVDENVGFTGGRGNGFFRTVDRGATWEKIYEPGGQIYDLVIGNDDALYLGALTNGILKSTDQGETWTPTLSINGARIRYMAKSPDGTIVAYNDSRLFHRSIDDGMTWDTTAIPNNLEIRGMFFASNDVGFAWRTTDVLRTTDGGVTWEVYDSPFSSGPRDGYYVNENLSYVITFNSLYTSTDGGLEWTSSPTGINSMSEIVFEDENHGYLSAGSSSGVSIYETYNAGVSWEKVYNNSYSYQDFAFINSDPFVVIAVGAGGVITRYEDAEVVGVFNHEKVNQFNIYPNPGTSNIRLEGEFKKVHLSIYSIQGQLVRELYLKDESNPIIDVQGLIPGAYLFQANDGFDLRISKWIKN